mmetsp:Transcript_22304/g.34038  ORF Transcript_22304/g.34038 Transcript_22304/m.34038 type:complete len:93 (-) Transcript_22304:96-374(-)
MEGFSSVSAPAPAPAPVLANKQVFMGVVGTTIAAGENAKEVREWLLDNEGAKADANEDTPPMDMAKRPTIAKVRRDEREVIVMRYGWFRLLL